MTTLHLDLETRSTVDLRRTGVNVYAEDPSTDVLCAAYAVDNAPDVALWTRADARAGVPHVIHFAVTGGWEIVSHNAMFERVLWKEVLGPRYGWPVPKLGQWRCTMAAALALSLPASLQNAAAAVGIEQGKDMGGRALMLQMSHPRRPRKGEDLNGLYWFEDEERLQKLYAYCKQDVVVERELDARLLRLRPSEQLLWQLDARINQRGVYVDSELCVAALKVVDQAERWLNQEIQELTDGAVSAVTNVAQIAKWCRLAGFPTTSLDKEAIDDLLSQSGLPVPVRRVLELRKEGAKAAVKKIDALVAGRSKDGRARGLLQFHAAGTGRWAGRRFQPQNIKRPELDDIDGAISAVATGDADVVRLVYGEPLSVVGDCLRGLVRAAPGNVLYAADFSNIEGRLQAWLAGEAWKLDAFRAFDAGTGPDVYKLAVRDLFSIPVERVTKEQRQKVGKVQELASGYQGGVSSYLKFGIEEAFPILIPTLRSSAAGEEWDEAWRKFTPQSSFGLSREQWTAVRISVDRWRNKHPNIVQCWYDLESAAKSAIMHRGKAFSVGCITFRCAGSFLFMRLPSGRCIAYPYPCIKDKLTPWGEMKPQVSYKGTDTYTRKWTDCFAHGGLLFNNAVQGIARDVEAEAMIRTEKAGYWNVLSVHDEIVCETKADFGSVAEFEALMTVLPEWAGGLPLAAGAWSDLRYRK